MPPQILPADTDLPPPQQHPGPAGLEGRRDTHTPPPGYNEIWGGQTQDRGFALAGNAANAANADKAPGSATGKCHRPAVPGPSRPGDAAAPPERGWPGTDPPGAAGETLRKSRDPSLAITAAPGEGRVLPPELAWLQPGTPPAHHRSVVTSQRVLGGPGVQLGPLHPPCRCYPCRWASQHGEHRRGCAGVLPTGRMS